MAQLLTARTGLDGADGPQSLPGSLLARDGVDRRAVLGDWDPLAGRAGGFDPSGLGPLDLSQRFRWRRSESRAGFEVGERLEKSAFRVSFAPDLATRCAARATRRGNPRRESSYSVTEVSQ